MKNVLILTAIFCFSLLSGCSAKSFSERDFKLLSASFASANLQALSRILVNTDDLNARKELSALIVGNIIYLSNENLTDAEKSGTTDLSLCIVRSNKTLILNNFIGNEVYYKIANDFFSASPVPTAHMMEIRGSKINLCQQKL